MLSQPIAPPPFAQKTIQILAELEQRSLTSAKKRPQSALKIRHNNNNKTV
jgi:hypothetical protein